ARQLEGSERYDLVLIMGGANDVLRFTRQEPWREHMALALRRAKARAGTVVLMPSGNVGNAPFFYPPASWLMTRRARTLHAMAREIAQQQGAVYVNLYRERQDDPFAQDPERMNASDHLHPSDAGYANWYGELRRQAGLDARIDALR
ncbi:MAG: family lipase, partial [Rhodoferax sp.]|nr:family lipase [Rhodoferax sp.]